MCVFSDESMDGKGGKPFDLLVTNVIKLHGLIRINGQTDLNTGQATKREKQKHETFI